MIQWVLRVSMLFLIWWTNNLPIMAQHEELILLSYNIYHGEDPYQPGKSNLQDITELINRIKPDLIALQEVDSMTNRTRGFNEGERKNLVMELEKATGLKGFFAKAIDFSEGGYGEAILSRYPAEFEKVQLPIPKGGEERSMAIAHVSLPDRSKLSFAATHLCHQFEENRTAQAAAISHLLTGLQVPVVLAGDFNFESDEKGYSVLSNDFKDAALEFGNIQETYSSKTPEIRIDYFWLDRNTNWEIISMEALDVEFSDHKPIVITLKIRK
jgi:endonuclease/exonuclease/phosphatase family metal-dependent hydrolase